MTFTEAAIEVLRREGKPLHFKKIAEIAVRDSLLDHVGKTPEDTMADQLAAHYRLPRPERRVIPVQAGTFALAEWGLDEDPAGIEGLIELPDDQELPYRGRERHPVPSREVARGAPRAEGGRGRRREEEERRGRRFPPPAEVAYEILAGAGRALSLTEIAAQGAERLLMPDAFVRDVASLAAALAEDNRRREGAGRRPLFQVDGDTVALIAQPEPGERPAPIAAPRPPSGPAELRRAALAALRRRLRECEPPTLEHVAVKLLERQGFRELKVAKRGRDHVIYTGRRRLGLAELRHAVRIVRSGGELARRDVSDLRRDLGHYGAQLGVVIGVGDAARDARGEASAAGQLPVILLCGEALAEALTEAGVGCVPVVVPDVDEDFFRAAAEAGEKEEAARRARREERDRRDGRDGREEREEREERREGREERRNGREGREREPRADERGPRAAPAEVSLALEDAPSADAAAPGAPAPAFIEVSAELADEEIVPADLLEPVDEDDLEGAEGDEDEGPEAAAEGAAEGAEGAAPGAGEGEGAAAPGERRRRRRRRRRRGGRGRGREGAAGTPGAPGPAAEETTAAPPQADAATAASAPPGEPPQAERAPAAAAPASEPTPTSASTPAPLPRDPGEGGGTEGA